MDNKYIGNWKWCDYSVLESTNDLALNYKISATDRFIITAQTQLNGRGRRGRKWISPFGNLYMSQLFFSVRSVNEIVYIVALSLAETIETLQSSLHPQIKWPNDILLDNQKIGGILIEQTSIGAYVIGIGVNLSSAPQSSRLNYPAASLCDFGLNISREEFMQTYIPLFEQNLLLSFAQITASYLARAYKLHQEITLNLSNKKISGQFIGIDDKGFLLLKQGRDTLTINTGEILFS